jgi:putative N6-adenine-specific DNA methylase
MKLKIFVACSPGLEPMLATEIAALDAPANVVPGGVETDGDATTLARLLVETGLSSHVLVRIASFPVKQLADLEGHVGRLPWSGFLKRNAPRRIRVTAQRSRLYHTGAIEERVARAITTRLGDAPPELADDEQQIAVPLAVRMIDDRCTISLDASGPPLHRRGYRLDPYKAPIREDLARALVIASGWDPSRPLLDPLCGSGTLVIEAGLIAMQKAPGLDRSFAVERTALDDGSLAKVRAAALARVVPSDAVLVGRDRDPRAIDAAIENAERAGVTVRFEVGPLSTARDAMGDARDVSVVTNPPWGGRLGDATKLRPLYAALGSLVRSLPGSTLTLAAHDRKLAYATGVPLESALLTDLGGTKVAMMVAKTKAGSASA